MLLLDGSPHLWLGPDLPILTLMLSTDDATGQPLQGLNAPQETPTACIDVLDHIIPRYGLPASLYLGPARQITTTRHVGTHRLHPDDQPTSNHVALDRLAGRLDVAHTPQARGRGDGINGSFQGRLVDDLRRDGITTPDAATDQLKRIYIPKNDARFAAKPGQPAPTFRKMPTGTDLRAILSPHHYPNIDKDNTNSLHANRYQPLPSRRTLTLAATHLDAHHSIHGPDHDLHPPRRTRPPPTDDRSTPNCTDYPDNAL